MRFKLLIPFIVLIPVLILQLTVIPYFSFDYIVPDLVVIILVYFTLHHGQIYGSLLGFTFGLIIDIVTGGILGSSMFSKTLAGFIAGYFFNENKISYNTGSFLFVFIVFLSATVDSMVHSFFSTTETNLSLFFIIFEQGLLPGMYTAIISLAVVFKNTGRMLE